MLAACGCAVLLEPVEWAGVPSVNIPQSHYLDIVVFRKLHCDRWSNCQCSDRENVSVRTVCVGDAAVVVLRLASIQRARCELSARIARASGDLCGSDCRVKSICGRRHSRRIDWRERWRRGERLDLFRIREETTSLHRGGDGDGALSPSSERSKKVCRLGQQKLFGYWLW